MLVPTPEFPTPVDESQPPFKNLRFLIVDDNPDGRFLVSKTLLRKFPKSTIVECQTGEAALPIVEQEKLSLIVAHRTYEYDGTTLVRELRARNASVPILMMSGINREEVATAAGANAFLTYEEWLLVGNHVASLLAQTAEAQSDRRCSTLTPATSR